MSDPGDGDQDPVLLGKALDRVLRGFGAPPADALASLMEAWDEVVGEPLAGRAQPIAVDGGTLIIGVDDTVLGAEARWRQAEVIARCDDLLGQGVITRIEVRIRP